MLLHHSVAVIRARKVSSAGFLQCVCRFPRWHPLGFQPTYGAVTDYGQHHRSMRRNATNVESSDSDIASIIMTPSTTETVGIELHVKDKLPDVSAIERPEKLAMKSPYRLTVQDVLHANSIRVQYSHQPSLRVLSEYLERWLRKDHGNSTSVSSTSVVPKQGLWD